MLRIVAKNWWAVALRGVVAIAFGIGTFVWPGLTLLTLAVLFSAYALTDGAFAIAAAVTGRTGGFPWWSLLVEGVVGVAAGVATFVWPEIYLLVLVYLIAAWAIATGAFEVVAAIRLRKEIEGEWALIAAGALSVLLGLALAVNPGAGLVTIAYMVGGYAVASGILLLSLAFRLRTVGKRLDALAQAG